MTRRTVGVLGGMGPAATLDFLALIQAATPVTREADHLRVLVDINPQVPDRNAAAAGCGPSPGPALAAMARGLVAQGAALLCMPCNAAHGWAGDIRAAVDVPFLSIVQAAAGAARAAGGRPGLLAVDATHAAGVYAAALPDALVPPAGDQAALMALVRRIKLGDTGIEVAEGMAALVDRLADAGASTVIAACTEVPLVLRGRTLPLPLVDPARALATEVVTAATRG